MIGTSANLLSRVFSPAQFRSELGDARAFLQGRVRLYVKTLFLVFSFLAVAGWLGIIVMAEELLGVRPESVYLAFSVFCTVPVIFGLGWALLAKARSMPLVSAVESVCSIAATTAMATTSAFAVHPMSLVDVLLVVVLVLVTRASFVPSSARRTLLIGLFSTASVSLFAHLWISQQQGLDVVEQQVTLAWITWGGTFSLVTALLSRVLYGLQETVRSALQLGNYTLVKRLNEGGMAEVYQAKHAWLRRPTVVKVLPPKSLGEAAITRFEREVQDTATLTHPNIVEIYDFGRTPRGLFYYAMEYVDGLNLAELTEDFGALPPGRVIYILAQVAHALGHAHDAGLVHRDVKPGNILVSDRGGQGDAATLLDFGLVKELSDNGDAELSRADSILGTPLYMAPESIRSAGEVDARVDLYALGAVAFFMLTGTHLFSGGSVVEICSQHLHAAPDTPSKRAGRQVCGRDLERVIARCLEKEPHERFSSALELRAALLECPEATSWGMDESTSWWREHRAEITAYRGERAEPLATARTLEAVRAPRGSVSPVTRPRCSA